MIKTNLRMILGTFLVALATGATSAVPSAADPVPGLLVVVTSENPQVQGMAMVLSKQSLGRGAQVRILLCGPGGDVALKGAPQVELKPRGMTPQGMLSGLVAQGVTVEVCALYLPNQQKQPSDLIEGVGVAKPPVIAEAMLAANTRLFTF